MWGSTTSCFLSSIAAPQPTTAALSTTTKSPIQAWELRPRRRFSTWSIGAKLRSIRTCSTTRTRAASDLPRREQLQQHDKGEDAIAAEAAAAVAAALEPLDMLDALAEHDERAFVASTMFSGDHGSCSSNLVPQIQFAGPSHAIDSPTHMKLLLLLMYAVAVS